MATRVGRRSNIVALLTRRWRYSSKLGNENKRKKIVANFTNRKFILKVSQGESS